MSKVTYHLDCCPCEEEAVSVGSPDYADRALRQVRAYIEAIRKVCGEEPEGARLRVHRASHDFGTYFEAIIEFDGDNRAASEYAAKVDDEAPSTWAEAGMAAPKSAGRGRS